MSRSIGRGYGYSESDVDTKSGFLWRKIGCPVIIALGVGLCVLLCVFVYLPANQADDQIRTSIIKDVGSEISMQPSESRLGDDVDLIVLVKNSSEIPIEKTSILLKNTNFSLQDDAGSFILRSPTPTSIGETPSPLISRTFVFTGIRPFGQQEYSLRLVAKSVGIYNLTCEVVVDQYRDFTIEQYRNVIGSGRVLFSNIVVASKKIQITVLPK